MSRRHRPADPKPTVPTIPAPAAAAPSSAPAQPPAGLSASQALTILAKATEPQNVYRLALDDLNLCAAAIRTLAPIVQAHELDLVRLRPVAAPATTAAPAATAGAQPAKPSA